MGSTDKFINASELGCKRPSKTKLKRKETPEGSFLKEVGEHIAFKKRRLEPHSTVPMIDRHLFQEQEDVYDLCDLHCLGVKFQHANPRGTVQDFITFCQQKMKPAHCNQIEKKTADQAGNGKWFKLRYQSLMWLQGSFNFNLITLLMSFRYGRPTASKFHEAAQCKTKDGVLTDLVLGAKLRDNAFMERGRNLEPQVLEEVEKSWECPSGQVG